jgi:RNA polymerase sigma-70 factor (ECF subfamily)
MDAYATRALEEYSDTVYRLAFAQMRTKHDADDVFQDVFLALVSKPRSFSNDEHLKAWLIRATVNRCKTLKTSAWFNRIVPLTELETTAVTFEQDCENDLSEYLALLPQKYRAVIHLFYYEEMPVAQISKVLKAKESTVRTWLTRARAILREKLSTKGDYFNEE